VIAIDAGALTGVDVTEVKAPAVVPDRVTA